MKLGMSSVQLSITMLLGWLIQFETPNSHINTNLCTMGYDEWERLLIPMHWVWWCKCSQMKGWECTEVLASLNQMESNNDDSNSVSGDAGEDDGISS